jgi:hypothetical protein
MGTGEQNALSISKPREKLRPDRQPRRTWSDSQKHAYNCCFAGPACTSGTVHARLWKIGVIGDS